MPWAGSGLPVLWAFMAIARMTEQQFEDLFHHHPHVVKLHQLLVALQCRLIEASLLLPLCGLSIQGRG